MRVAMCIGGGLGFDVTAMLIDIPQYSNTEVITVEGVTGNQIPTTNRVAIDMSRFLATHSNNKAEIHTPSQGLMEDESNMDKVSIY
jgi:hypothetical protein